jgi:Predicted Zn-dependent proteases and their inactivated homologs
VKQELKKNIDSLMAQGATYVDARWYPTEESNSLMMWNGNLKDLSSSSQTGVGVRVLYHGAGAFPPHPAWKIPLRFLGKRWTTPVRQLNGWTSRCAWRRRTLSGHLFPVRT